MLRCMDVLLNLFLERNVEPPLKGSCELLIRHSCNLLWSLLLMESLMNMVITCVMAIITYVITHEHGHSWNWS